MSKINRQELKATIESTISCYDELKRKCNERSAQWEYFDGYQQSMKDVLQLIGGTSDE